MIFTETKFKGAYIIDVKKISDDRGFFGRSFCIHEFEQHGLNTKLVQVNVSHNPLKGTLRGLHLQVAPNEEAKLVRCTKGSIYDVMVDMRKSSETYLQWFGTELSAESFRMLYVPEGFAHGYLTLENDTDVSYQVTQFYAPNSERGHRWDDPAININWPIIPVLISEKDKAHPFIKDTVDSI